MNRSRSIVSESPVLNRRSFCGLSAAGLAGLALGVNRHHAAAEGVSGEITVQFSSRGGALEAAVTQVTAALQAANPGAKITIADPIGGSYETQLALALNTGQGPDVFLVTSALMAEIAEAGFVAPLDGYTAAWPDWEQFLPVFKQNILYKQSVWGLPYLLDTHFLYYQKDVFAKAGLPADWEPKTVEDIATAAMTIKSAAPGVVPFALFAGANPGNSTAVRGFVPQVTANGGQLVDENGKWIIDSCAIRAALGFYERAYQTDQFVPQEVMTTVSATDAMRQAFAMGQVGILFDGCWVWDDWMKAIPDAESKIGYVLHPKADGSAPFTVSGFGNAWFINKKAAAPDLGWAFIAAMNSKEIQIALNLDDLHVPSRTDAANDPTFQSTPFNQAMVASMDSATFLPLDPNLRSLIGIIQKATGSVATGESDAAGAVDAYASELKRVLGDDHVIAQACQ